MKKSKQETFNEYTRKLIFEAQNGYCVIEGCLNKIDDFHHKLPNTKANRKLFLLFLQSPFNCVGVCRDHHTRRREFQCLNVTRREAIVYEAYLVLALGEEPLL